MATTIKLKNGSGAPTSGDLVQGEPALDLTNKRLYTEDSGGSVIEVGTNPSTLTVTGDLAVDTNTLFVDSSANAVGIGTASPFATLEVNGSIRTTVGSGGTISAYDATAAANRTVLGADASGGFIQTSYSSGGDVTLRFIQGATERMRIDDSGNVGIGETSPSAKLTVKATGNDVYGLRVGNDAGGSGGVQGISKIGLDTGVSTPTHASALIAVEEFDAADFRANLHFATRQSNSDVAPTTAMTIDSSGNVGIGTASPAHNLEVSGANARIRVTDSDSVAASATAFYELYGTDTRAGALYTQGGSLSIKADTGNLGLDASGDVYVDAGAGRQTYTGVGNFQINAAGSSGLLIHSGSADTGYITFGDGGVAGRITYNHASDAMQFGTTNGTADVTLDSGGRLGLGTASPATELHLVGSTPQLRFSPTSDSQNCRVEFTNAAGTLQSWIGGGGSNGRDINFIDGPSFANRMTIEGDTGNVGIGNNNPTYTLDVKNNGAAYAPAARFTDNGDAANWARVDIKNNNATNNDGLLLYQDNGGNVAIRNNNSSGSIVGTSFIAGNTTAGYFDWQNTAGNTAMRLDSGGKLGVGTDIPARTLHVDAVMRLEPTTTPSSPAAGDLYFDSSTNKLRCYDGTAWNDCF